MDVARTFYESALADYDHALVLDPEVRFSKSPCVCIVDGEDAGLLSDVMVESKDFFSARQMRTFVTLFRLKSGFP